ncbi:MAG: hypothetical protein IT534_14090 [Bauldia sp.]|nr:hypothetical protein [Bauldia sp.]
MAWRRPETQAPSIRSLLSVFRHSPRLAIAFTVAAAVALFFAVRLVIGIFGWDAPPNEEIRPWMTVGYIGRSWNVEPRDIDALAGLPLPEDRASEPRPYTLQEIADERGVPVEEIIAAVAAALEALRDRTPPEPPSPPAPPATP